jgi:hypothetical protein
LPAESFVAIESAHGPFPGPPLLGVAMMTKVPFDAEEVVIEMVAVPDFVESCTEVAFTVADPDTGMVVGAV